MSCRQPWAWAGRPPLDFHDPAVECVVAQDRDDGHVRANVLGRPPCGLFAAPADVAGQDADVGVGNLPRHPEAVFRMQVADRP